MIFLISVRLGILMEVVEVTAFFQIGKNTLLFRPARQRRHPPNKVITYSLNP